MHSQVRSQPHGHHTLHGRQTASTPLPQTRNSVVNSGVSVLLGPGGQLITSGDGISQPAVGFHESSSQPGDQKEVYSASSQTTLVQTSIAFVPASEAAESPTSAVTAAPPASAVTNMQSSLSVPPSTQGSTSVIPSLLDPSSSVSATTPVSSSEGEGSPPTSRLDSSSTASSRHNPSIYAGLALGVIAGVGLIAAILAWWLRTRTRTRRRAAPQQAWPWDHDSLGARLDTCTLASDAEGGLGIHTDDRARLCSWDPSLMEREKPPTHPPSLDSRATPLVDSHAFPLPPPPPAYLQLGSPFITVPLHDNEQSVPDLAQDVGRLQITNLMPGDISSGETSRASSALGIAHAYPADFGTPYQPQRPAFLSLRDGGLELPWAPLRTRKPKAGDTPTQEKLEEALPFPGDGASEAMLEGWAASIRTNIFSAFNAVVGNSASQSSAVVIREPDTFTRPHLRTRSKHRSSPHGPRDSYSRSSSARSVSSGTGWSLEETTDGRGVVHIRANPRTVDPFSDDMRIQVPPATLIATHDSRGHLAADPSGSVTRASSVYSTLSTPPREDRPTRVGLHPPRLPSIPNLSSDDVSNSRDVHVHVRKDTGARYKGSQHRKRTKRQRRPTLATRKSSSQASATSVGSEMSRASSADSAQLTDGERFAKQVLRERRRRMLEMAVGRSRTRRSRVATLSQRRLNAKQEQKG